MTVLRAQAARKVRATVAALSRAKECRANASHCMTVHLHLKLHLKAQFTFLNKVRMGMIEVLPRAMRYFDQFYIGVDLLFVTFTPPCGRHLKNCIFFLMCL